MDRLEAMAAFVAVVETGSFSAAAKRLRAPLATVSRRVAELERHLRVQLLARSTRKLALTDAGVQYLRTCQRVLEDINEAERLASGEYIAPKGNLVVSAPVVFGKLHLMPVLLEFLHTYPDIDVELRLIDVAVDLIEQHIDVALRIGELEDSSLLALRVGDIRHVVCASPDYLATRALPLRPSDLAGHDCVTLTPLHAPTVWEFSTDGDRQARVGAFTVGCQQRRSGSRSCGRQARVDARALLSGGRRNPGPGARPCHA
jgi:DNA-binding transcriptional LysR family regulator